MRIRITLGNTARQDLHARLHTAIACGSRQLVKRINVLLFIDQQLPVRQVAEALDMGEQTVRDVVRDYLLKGVQSLRLPAPRGAKPRINKTQRLELKQLVESGPEACGYPSGCWSSVMIAHLIQTRFNVTYHPHYVCQLLKELGFSFQKARFVSDHLSEAARKEWKEQLWPKIIEVAKTKKAKILFGDEASFAQWGSLSYTWSPIGKQPTVKTSGTRRGYKVFGLIDAKSGDFYFKGQEGRFNSESYKKFLLEVFDAVPEHIILIHDRVRYHTSAAMKEFYALHADRISVFELPAYSPDFNPIEFLWKKVKKRGTHLRYFPDFERLVASVEDALFHFSRTPKEIVSLTGQYCESLGQLQAA